MAKLKVFLAVILFLLVKESNAQKSPFLKSFDLGIDYLKLATFAIPGETKAEGIAALNFGFGLSVDGEYGYTKKTPIHMIKNGSYTFEGTYYRIGLSYNAPLSDVASIGLGFRYAASEFKDQTEYKIKSVLFDDYTERFSSEGLSARWIEVVLKSEAGIKKVKNLKAGMFLRLKLLSDIKEPIDNKLNPVRAIPGYGQENNNKTFAINFFIKYSIPLSR